ncbi:MAG TPA: sugar ABC transporter permease [Mycobacteriales bacterium]|nr:sugar ABC transporter permease [Mycobacteriales bacterium]
MAAWRRRDLWWGLFFVGPQTLLMVAFVLVPFAVGLALAFTNWGGFGALHWIGLSNFSTELHDPIFRKAVVNTLIIAAVTVPIGLGLAVVLATALEKVRLRSVYLTLLFLPVVTSSVAVSMIWQQLLQPQGPISTAVSKIFGIAPPDWLNNPGLILFAVCAVAIWSSLGLNVVIFLAGLQTIDENVVEAARVDGAGPIRIFWSIKMPLLSPTMFFSTVVAVISSFQTFDIVYVLTSGDGPGDSARTMVYHIYDVGFLHTEFGLSSAAAVILFLLTMVVTLAQFALQGRFVHYES